MKVRLTDLSVRSLAAPATGTITYFDDAVPGLGLRVSAGGTRAYTLVFGPSRTRTAIGRVGVISLAGSVSLHTANQCSNLADGMLVRMLQSTIALCR